MWNLAVDLYNAAMRALGIHSPSKVFAKKVGEMIPAGIGVGIERNEDAATDSVKNLANSVVDSAKNIKMPPVAMGEVIPYSIKTSNTVEQVTLKDIAETLQYLESSMVTLEELKELINNVIENMPDFYIGDESLARHVNRGNSLLDRRYNPVKA